MKKAAIFDMDGLLLDTEKIYQDGWRKLAPLFVEHPHPDVPKACCGSAGEQVIQILREYYPGVDGYAYLQSVIHYYAKHVEKEISLKPGVKDLLEYFKEQGVKMAVASSTFPQQIHRNLTITGIISYFNVIVSSLEVEHNKPYPDVFLKAADKLGYQPSDCYVFEDAVNGVKAGLAAGCSTIMIPESQDPISDFYQSCTGIYDNLEEALIAIKNENKDNTA